MNSHGNQTHANSVATMPYWLYIIKGILKPQSRTLSTLSQPLKQNFKLFAELQYFVVVLMQYYF